jgi:predicted Zn-dependent protease
MRQAKRYNFTSSAAAAVLAIAIALGVSGCKEDDIERSLGAQSAAAVEKQYRMDDDPLLNAWVNTIGQTLVGQSSRQQIPYTFKIIDTDMVNAFAAPYGHIYLLRGMLDFADNEDEVWFITGHEISHVVHRHSIRSLKKSIMYSLGASILGGKSGALGDIAGLGSGLLLLHYSRDNEREADDGGVNLVYAAGYDPAGALSFFERLHSRYEGSRPSQLEHLLLTHPPTPSRMARQSSRPYLDRFNPETALHVARGYQRRHRLGTATDLFNCVIEAAPNNTGAQLGLADSLAALGRLDAARSAYDQVLQVDSDNRYASRALAALPNRPMQAPPLSATERAQAQALLTQAQQQSSATRRMTEARVQFNKALADNFTDAVQVSRNSADTLLKISDADPDLTDQQRSLFLVATATINAANTAVYALETLQTNLTAGDSQNTELNKQFTATLRQCAEGSGSANDVAIAARARAELLLATADYQSAVSHAPEAIWAANAAQAAVADTLAYMQLMAKEPKNTSYTALVVQAAEKTAQLSIPANTALNKIKNTTRQAEIRELTARINLAGLGQSPEVRKSFDGLVAYYTLSRPQQVSALRDLGYGHGDAAVALAATHSTGLPANSYSSALDDSLVTALTKGGARLQGAMVLLRYLANSMEREAELAQTTATAG